MSATAALPTIFPGLAYRNCPAAIDWLTRVLGFTRHLVVAGKAGRIDHAELRFGTGLIMVSSTSDDGRDWLGDIAGPVGIALVADAKTVDATYARVQADGARIVRPLSDTSYGEYGDSHGFTCLDAEGNRWTVSTYQPAARAPM